FQIATERTSWIAVSEEPAVDPTRPARRVRIPHALADGLLIEGLGLRSRGLSKDVMTLMMSMSAGVPTLGRKGVVRGRIASVQRLGFTPRGSQPSPPAPSAAHGSPKTPPAMEARLVLRKDRELTFEIDVVAPLDWWPGKSIVRWSDGTTVAAQIIADR